MSLTDAQRVALRFGAAMLVLAAVVLAVLAVVVDSAGPTSQQLRAVGDATRIPLPPPGLFGGQVVVYGEAPRPGVRAADLGCRLYADSGHELSRAKLSHLAVLGSAGVPFDGRTLTPLFAVRDYPSGAVVKCSGAGAVAPVAVSTATTFGSAAGLVKVTSAAAAGVALLLGIGGWVALRRPRTPGATG